MSDYSVVEHPSAEQWKSFLNAFSEGNFEQCFEYGEVCRTALPKTRVARLAMEHEGKLVAIVQGTYTSLLGFGLTFKVKHGPLVSTRDIGETNFLVERTLEAMEDYGKRKRIVEAEIWVPEFWQQKEAFANQHYAVARTLNEYAVNLEKGTDELWKNVSHNKRKNVKKAAEAGVEVVSSNKHEELLTFYSMLEAAEERGGFSTYALPWFETVRKMYDIDLTRIFLARRKDKDLSAVFTVAHGKTLYALAAGSFKEGWEVRSNDKMHWEVMKWASQHGYLKYHMGFVLDPPPTEGSSTWGIWRWKREWNGNLERILIFGKLLSPRYKLVLRARNLISKHAK
jgi:hypothetical protein